jgi:hypothetical protein
VPLSRFKPLLILLHLLFFLWHSWKTFDHIIKLTLIKVFV